MKRGFASDNNARVHHVQPRVISLDAGVDVLAFGGAKNGLIFGQALLVSHEDLARSAPCYRKQAMQLASMMRFLSAQFTAIQTLQSEIVFYYLG